MPTKDRRQKPAKARKFNKNLENNDIVNHAADDIILQEKIKLSAEDDAHENADSEINEYNIYEIDNMSLDENKENK